MRSISRIIACLALALAPVSAAMAQSSDGDIWSHVINMQSAGSWSLMPARPRPQIVNVTGQPSFTQAWRVHVSGAGANPWTVQATSPAGAAIAQGHKVFVMFFARAETPAPNGSVLPVQLQLGGAPYTSLVGAQRHITGDWAQYCMLGTAAANFPKESNVTIHLATAAQTIDLGPVFVFDLGTDFDTSQLPNCDQ